MGNFWVQLAIREAISLSEAIVESSKLTPSQKTALMNFIGAGQVVLADFTTSSEVRSAIINQTQR